METEWECKECGVKTIDDQCTRFKCPVCKKYMEHKLVVKQETEDGR